MDLVPSVVWNGCRWRCVWNRLHYRPVAETFHEFLVFIVKTTLGEAWQKAQLRRSADQRHAVMQWCSDWADLTRTRSQEVEPDGTLASNASGPTWALLQLGYDLFILQARNKLPDFLIKRLRDQRQFQGARYEIAVAAIMARAGFEIEYLDDQTVTTKHCELIATHAASGLQVGVEAKSRHRSGVLNQKGTLEYSGDARGIADLLSAAKKQKPDGLPFLIFIDINLPPDPNDNTSFDDKPMVKDVKAMLSDGCRPDRPDPFAALFITNFAQHYGWADGNSYKGDWIMSLPSYSQNPLPAPLIQRIYETAGRYEHIPNEI